MRIEFTGQGMEVTQALREFTQDKMSKIERHFDYIVEPIHVIFKVANHSQIAEGRIHVKGAEIIGTADSEDMYTSIDKMIAKLDRQLSDRKGKFIHERDR